MSGATRVPIWDLPTRLFHWLLVPLFAFSWWSGETHAMDGHRFSGYFLLGLLLFRLIWGSIGGSTARFASFMYSPRRVLAYLQARTPAPTKAGHNPLGGYSVLAMLLLLGMQIATGLFAVDIDGLESGPLSYAVSFEQGRAASKIHALSFNLLLGMVCVHVLAILYYLIVLKRNLITPMVFGSTTDFDPEQVPLMPSGRFRLLVAIVAAGAFAWWAATGFNL